MKFALLELIYDRFNNFRNIDTIKRIDNNILKITFDKNNHYFIDLVKGNSMIYKKDGFQNNKDFNAPFDILLAKRFSNAKIDKIYLLGQDKILRFCVHSSNSYKKLSTILQLEFTGKHTNAIVLDENEIVIEALRHISENISSRSVKVGSKLENIPPREFTKKEFQLDCDIDTYLLVCSQAKEENSLDILKKQKLNNLQKLESDVINKLASLQNKDELLARSQIEYNKANLLLANIGQIKEYQKIILLKDFDGTEIKVDFAIDKTPQQFINQIFNEAKKLKQKAQKAHIEQENLEDKLSHIKKMEQIVMGAKNLDELEFYFPKKEKNQKVTKKLEPYQSFLFKGYKILVGRSAKENEWLLKNSKASDFWFHLKDRPSSHVFVQNIKKELAQNIIEEAAIICAKFSCEFGGGYEVDFTQRRNIKIQNGSNVTYTEYKTIFVRI